MSLLACCIYGHFLSSLNRAGCAGSLRSPLQMVCIMFKPPPPLPPPLPLARPPPLLSLSSSLPFSINHQISQTLCVWKKKEAFSLQKGIRKKKRRSYKMDLGSLSTSNTPTPTPYLLLSIPSSPPPASRHPCVLVMVLSYLPG